MLATLSSQHKPGSSHDHFHSKNVQTDCVAGPIIPFDTIDNPVFKKRYLESDKAEENIFLDMKYEANRLYSFSFSWPLPEIKPESLAEAGFFYLQDEDKVQCPFCYVILSNWTHGDKPLKEHMRKSPKCPFLVGSDVGNIPSVPGKKNETVHMSQLEKAQSSHSVTASYKPKHPKMADSKRRILTFSGWPLSKPGPEVLAECGLYYSGIADVVTCFFCGGTLGNWEPQDEPWTEHSKYFPECSFLALSKKKHCKSTRISAASEKKLDGPNSFKKEKETIANVSSDVIKQALDIFPEQLVIDAVKRKSGPILSLQELCDDILEQKSLSSHQETSFAPIQVENSISDENSSTIHDTLLCKLCMDRERGVVFQPCGHLVSCWQCSNLISDCPVCRKPISYKIKIYLS